MKRNIIILLLILLLTFSISKAQYYYLIQGYVFDSTTKNAVTNAEIIISESNFNAITDEKGFFSVKSPIRECNIEVHCISYNLKKIHIDNTSENVNIFVSSKSYNLSPAEITTNKPKDIMPGKRYQIMDYEFAGNDIVILAYEKQSVFSPKLLLINHNGDTLCTIDVTKPLKLCSDFDGKIFYISKTESYEINIDSNFIRLCNPISNESFDRINKTIIVHAGNNYYLKQYLCNNQILNYFNFDEVNNNLNCFRSISDEDNIRRNRWGSYFDGKEEDLRFQELIINHALNAPLFKLHDTIFLLNFLQSKLEKYSVFSDTLSEVNIDFNDDKSFTNDLFIDKIQSKVYTLFRKNGISLIKQISTVNGEIIQSIEIPDFVFIEKIKIYDGKVYFLYKTKDLTEYKKLYCMKI